MCTICKNAMIGKKSKKNSRRRRSASRMNGIKKNDVQGLLMNQVLPIAAGALVTNKLDPQIQKLLGATNAKYSYLVKIGLGGAIALTQKGFVQGAGLGMLLDGAVGKAKEYLDAPSGDKVGLYPPYYETYALAGTPEAAGEAIPEVRLKEGILK